MAQMKAHWIRVGDSTWARATKRAQTEGSSASARAREFLEEYADEAPSLSEELERIERSLKSIRKRLTIGDE